MQHNCDTLCIPNRQGISITYPRKGNATLGFDALSVFCAPFQLLIPARGMQLSLTNPRRDFFMFRNFNYLSPQGECNASQVIDLHRRLLPCISITYPRKGNATSIYLALTIP